MHIDTEFYSKESLTEKDKAAITEAEILTDALFVSDVLDEYIEDNYSGELQSKLIREVINSYINYLRIQRDAAIHETIVEMIDNYSDEELAKIAKRRGVVE